MSGSILRDAGRRGGRKSGERRLVKGRESVLACKTARELLAEVLRLEHNAWRRGYDAGRRRGYADATGEKPEVVWRGLWTRDALGQFTKGQTP